MSSNQMYWKQAADKVLAELAQPKDESLTYCMECGKVTTGFRLCDHCDNIADIEFEQQRDIENEDKYGN